MGLFAPFDSLVGRWVCLSSTTQRPRLFHDSKAVGAPKSLYVEGNLISLFFAFAVLHLGP
jgi:hypothetical protein